MSHLFSDMKEMIRMFRGIESHNWEPSTYTGKDYFANYTYTGGELRFCRKCDVYQVRLNQLAPIGERQHTVWLTITKEQYEQFKKYAEMHDNSLHFILYFDEVSGHKFLTDKGLDEMKSELAKFQLQPYDDRGARK
jgi:hypothetical protein